MRGLPGEAQRQGASADGRGGDDDLQPAEPDDGPAQRPELRGLEFEADEEQHDDDAEFGEVHDVRPLAADEAQDGGADDHAGDEIAQHRAQPQPRGERGGDDGGGEIDEGAEEKVLRVHQAAFAVKGGGRVKPGASRESGIDPCRRAGRRSGRGRLRRRRRVRPAACGGRNG